MLRYNQETYRCIQTLTSAKAKEQKAPVGHLCLAYMEAIYTAEFIDFLVKFFRSMRYRFYLQRARVRENAAGAQPRAGAHAAHEHEA